MKRLLDDDHGALINNRETLEKLLKRYRVRKRREKSTNLERSIKTILQFQGHAR